MHNNSFFKIILIVISIVFLSSCDKDFNTIGNDLVGDDHFGLEHSTYDVLSYNQKVGPVQSNNLPVNALGVYEDPVFGTTEASFATQVVLASVNPTIGNNAIVDNVVLSIPYFSTLTSTDATSGDNTYRLDSIYGPETGKIKLSVYENGYFMRDLDPDAAFLEPQKYYTNQGADFDALKKATRLNDSIVSQNDEFFFDNKEFKVTTPATTTDGTPTITRTPPAMRLALNKGYFQTSIIDAAASGKLITNDVFKNYFRGLYFKVEKSGSNPGRLAMMNFKAGTVTINYKEDNVVTTTTNGVTTTTTTRVSRSIVLNLTGNTVNLLSNTNQPSYNAAITNPNSAAGDSRLYLRGGEGSMAVLELFNKTDLKGYDADGNLVNQPNGVSDELDDLKYLSGKKKLLVNEANLVFHIDGDAMGSNKLPNRIYLYDLTNNAPVLDYLYDGTTGTNVKSGQLIYSGILNPTNTSDKTYKIRLTNQIRSLVKNRDSVNVKLGVVVTEDIRNSTINKLRLPLQTGTTLTKLPQASVMSPLGVVLHGSKSTVADDKRLKLEIYYTKPD
ncbi:DUF4270 domain-containing protein [Flavobacterium sufflavum]|uniref:DUF4270 domain-containing protein n=1 Tax=Flavobacterium sufflavum TaxID=1921138 RepID=A0A437L389_9FLAO|nr:DUF4270 domain-containing protein [Flavobacterium sufflavum]RVT79789.1 DUF4270 domain-containing protein [Flavobacterium sufflavum]